ncbi:MAG TPA: iron-containing redox enzyme family protein [Candidatus Angelobacter sp.]|jgi:pyrroloquinoline quinone (PQQ) biosynthesis protein C
MAQRHVLDSLKNNALRKDLIHHRFFGEIKSGLLTRSDVAVFLGQWWHPLHYFPNFLSRSISVVPWLETKTAICAILSEELGEGDPAMAHERIYLETMAAAGFSQQEVAEAPPLESTRKLIKGYERASTEHTSALGFVYGTEVADLAMVSGIGAAVRQVSGMKKLPWVDIHVLQEPNHVDKASNALEPEFSTDDYQRVVSSAEEMWRLWIAFFSELSQVFDNKKSAESMETSAKSA